MARVTGQIAGNGRIIETAPPKTGHWCFMRAGRYNADWGGRPTADRGWEREPGPHAPGVVSRAEPLPAINKEKHIH